MKEKKKKKKERPTRFISVDTEVRRLLRCIMAKCRDTEERKHLKPTPIQIPTSARPPKRERGGEGGNIYKAFIHFYLDHNYKHTSHLSTAHFSTYVNPLDHNPLLPRAYSATNNPEFWSHIQINQNNLWRAHIYAP